MIERFTTEQNIKKGNIDISKKRISGVFLPHWHEFYEIEFVTGGDGEYIIDNKSHKIKKGMLFFMTPMDFHEVRTDDAQIVNIMFSDIACVKETLFSLISSQIENAVYFGEGEYDFISSLLSELINSAKADDSEYAHSLLDVLLLKLARKNNMKKNARLSYVQSAILYLMNNFRQNPTLCETAASIGISPSYLSMLFHAEAGITFKGYLDSLRFEYAKNLLFFSSMTISEICYESGFDDYANFIRHFKKRYGKPPAQIRKTGSM